MRLKNWISRLLTSNNKSYKSLQLSPINAYIALIFIPANNVNLLYAFQLIASILYNSLGIFDCIIYVRPRIQMLQVMYPQDPFVVVLRVAMLSH